MKKNINPISKPVHCYLIFDWETGGLDAKKVAVTELAMIAMRADNFEEVGRISTYIQPYGNYEYQQQALDITGITYDDINSGIDIKDLVKQIIELCKKASFTKRKDAKPILVAHNVLFDISFLQQVFDHTGEKLEDHIQGKKDFYGNFIPQYVDTVELSKNKWNREADEIKNYKLETCCIKAGIDVVDTHRAINDTIALKELFIYLTKCLRQQSDGMQVTEEFRFRKTFEF